MSVKKRRWLILSHCYNMDGRAASQTITDKIPFLHEHNIEPIVVSALTGEKDKLLEHYQVPSLAPSGLKFEARHLIRSKIQNNVLRNLAKFSISALLLVPYLLEKIFVRLDSHWSWAFCARNKCMKLLKSKKFELIYSTGGANCAHHAASMLKKRIGLPWIAEIHDPMYNKDWPINTKTKWSQKLEKKICKEADLIWWFTDKAKERAQKRNPLLGKKGHVIIPGCECPKFSTTYKKDEFFNLAHFGSLHETRNLVPLIKAISKNKESDPLFCSKTRLHIYGSHLDSYSRTAAKNHGVEDMIIEHGRVEKDPLSGKSGRQQVLDAMRCADLLILLHGESSDCEEYIPSKLYEYLWTQRPVLGIIWKNKMLERILKEHKHSSYQNNEVAEISNSLKHTFNLWKNNTLQDNGRGSSFPTSQAVSDILGFVQNELR